MYMISLSHIPEWSWFSSYKNLNLSLAGIHWYILKFNLHSLEIFRVYIILLLILENLFLLCQKHTGALNHTWTWRSGTALAEKMQKRNMTRGQFWQLKTVVSEKPMRSYDFSECAMGYRRIQPAGTLFGYMPKTDNSICSSTGTSE